MKLNILANRDLYLLVGSSIPVWMTASTIYMILPIYFQTTLGFSKPDVGILISAGTLAGIISSFIGGAVSDLVGRKPVLVLAAALYGLSFIPYLFLQSFKLLLLVRFVEGFAMWMIPAVMSAAMADITPTDKRGQGMGLIISGNSIGMVVGPIIAGLIITFGQFTTYFLYCTISSILSALITVFLVKEPKAMSRGWEGSKKFSLCRFRQSAKNLGRPAVNFIGGSFIRSLGATMLSPFLSLFFQSRGLSLIQISTLYTVPYLISFIATPLVGKLSDQIGRKRLYITSMTASGVAFSMYIYASTYIELSIVAVLTIVITSITSGIGNALLSELLSESNRGFGLGVFNSFIQQTSTIGAFAGGYIIESYGFTFLFMLNLITSIIGTIIVTLAVPEPKSE